jgi:hypothetical protein
LREKWDCELSNTSATELHRKTQKKRIECKGKGESGENGKQKKRFHSTGNRRELKRHTDSHTCLTAGRDQNDLHGFFSEWKIMIEEIT